MTNNKNDPTLFLFLNEIGIIDQLARAKMESTLPDGLRMSQFIVLNHLVRLGGLWSPARLASAFQLTKGAMTNTLQRLEARGLIEVSADPDDGRGKLVGLTEAGAEMRERCIDIVAPFLIELEKTFGRKRIADAIPLLTEVRQFLDKDRS
mgnify:CR=1 FL=1